MNLSNVLEGTAVAFLPALVRLLFSALLLVHLVQSNHSNHVLQLQREKGSSDEKVKFFLANFNVFSCSKYIEGHTKIYPNIFQKYIG